MKNLEITRQKILMWTQRTCKNPRFDLFHFWCQSYTMFFVTQIFSGWNQGQLSILHRMQCWITVWINAALYIQNCCNKYLLSIERHRKSLGFVIQLKMLSSSDSMGVWIKIHSLAMGSEMLDKRSRSLALVVFQNQTFRENSRAELLGNLPLMSVRITRTWYFIPRPT